jgi:flagellar hook assembly protein FlgD
MINVVQTTDRAVYLADHINNQIVCLTWKADAEQTISIPTLSLEKLSSPTKIISITSKPNPFTPSTLININGLQPTELRSAILAVYDASGKCVADLSSSVRSGKTSIKWIANDASDRSLPSGVYYLRLTTTNKKTIIRSMMLIK